MTSFAIFGQFTLSILFIASLADSFAVTSRVFGSRTVREQSQCTASSTQQCRSAAGGRLTTVLSAQSIGSTVDKQTRNMFQSIKYDKPIVLLGCSGEGNELNRLAKSLLHDMSGGRVDESSGIFTPERTEGTIEEQTRQLLDQIEGQKASGPNVIVLDYADDSLTDQYTEIANVLYTDAGLLSIYVNVHPDHMSSESANRKAKLENDVFVKNSDYELCIKGEGSVQGKEWEHIEWEMRRLVARARLVPAIPGSKDNNSVNNPSLTMGTHTFFLSLSFPDIREVEPYVEEMCGDVDAMEYRADLLDCRDNRFDLIYGQQLLRKYCRPYAKRAPCLPFYGSVIDDSMPVVYTVRTEHQAGTYPDDESGIAKMFELLEWGLRSGVEVLDVESAWDNKKIDKLLTLAEQRYSTLILGSHHVVGEEVSTEEAVKLFQQCALSGRAHGAKVVLSVEEEERDRMAYEAAMIASILAEKNGDPVIPSISLILGDHAKFSRVLNFPFTPVTHESLPFEAAPGQMTSSEIMTTRLLTKLFQSKRYCILGHNIAYSVSPQMQGAAFEAARLPHQYYRADVETVEEFVESDFFNADDFGGCSITIPHKQAIIPYVDEMSDAASAIGSVNTLIVKEVIQDDEVERVVFGENTDWRGIFNPLERKLGGKVTNGYALIIGAGGTARAAAYAAEKLGLDRIYYNRTPSKAADLAESFGGVVVSSLDSSDGDETSLMDVLQEGNDNLRVVISTLPAAAEFTLPEWVVSKNKPIVFDVNYKPYNTKLLLQAESGGCNVVRGSEMLWEQGVDQFELWTERTAPYKVMKEAVLENCLPKAEQVEEDGAITKNAQEETATAAWE